MNDEARVLIVGAGPVGLVTACALLRRGVPVRVVDAAEGPGRGSRAILLWPPTLEVLDEVGVRAEAEAAGVLGTALTYHMGKVLRVPLDRSNAPLLLPQERTGQILGAELERLGGRVEWATRATGVDQKDDRVAVTLEGPGGVEVAEADWLIGADGIGSTVRQQLGVEFLGENIPTTFLLAEGYIDGEFARTEVHYHIGPKGVLLFAPLPERVVRISCPVPDGTVPDLPTVQRYLDERGPAGLTVTGLNWQSTFTSQERVAARLRQGRCFLVGDAAHVHSVAGGQGLNLGIQDARNLAWKLAGVIAGQLPERILDTYDAERRAAAEDTVRSTGEMTRRAMVTGVALWARNLGFWLLQVTGALRTKFAPMLAGWATRYPDVLFAQAAPGAKALGLPGTRTPKWVPRAQPGGAPFRLVVTASAGGELDRAARALAGRRPELVGYAQVGHGKAGFLLLRPDGFVAASGTSAAELETVDGLLSRLVAADAAGPVR